MLSIISITKKQPNMKSPLLILPILTLCIGSLYADPIPAPVSLSRPPAPQAGKVAADLFWVADSRKMDEFLASIELPTTDTLPGSGEVLPDTRTAWREYATQARRLAKQGRTTEAAERLAQMLKLAAVYRAFSGLENIVQSEEIRYLTAVVSDELGSAITAQIHSPYLEKTAAQCIASLESRIGAESSQMSASFRKNLAQRAIETHARLSQANNLTVSFIP
jgi:hypothetical protein